MYSNKENINILTSLLVAHGVKHAVVCPGSRNAAIIHNFSECPHIVCHPVTDERSAAFVALGIAQATGEPTVVCVTSGTALLNTAPAVAEATYQHHGIIVVSADRPTAWIGQNDGQTMPQVGALGSFVGKCVNIPEPHTDEDRWHVNRSVNEALIETKKSHRPSVHINVPLSEPLFEYTAEELPAERVIHYYNSSTTLPKALINDYLAAQKPMIVMGAMPSFTMIETEALVLNESMSGYTKNFDEVLAANDNEEFIPDFVLYLGGDIVSKRLKRMIRNANTCMWAATEDGEIHDLFKNAKGVINGLNLKELASLKGNEYAIQFKNKWEQAITKAEIYKENFTPAYSEMQAVKLLEQHLCTESCFVHYANSSAIRLANIFASHFVRCNRGINGIEGSVSTAVGFAMAVEEPVFLVTGDLSFFYDQNALWNENMPKNLHIMLLNNGEGGIFKQVKGFGQNDMAVGKHITSAEGICHQNNVDYLSVHNETELQDSIKRFLNHEGSAVLMEVFTNANTDIAELKRYYSEFKNLKKIN